jgi:hypothetical protein
MVQPRLLAILSEQLYYDEIAIPFTRMQNECKQLIALLADAQIDVSDRLNCSVFTIDQANELVRTTLPLYLCNIPKRSNGSQIQCFNDIVDFNCLFVRTEIFLLLPVQTAFLYCPFRDLSHRPSGYRSTSSLWATYWPPSISMAQSKLSGDQVMTYNIQHV